MKDRSNSNDLSLIKDYTNCNQFWKISTLKILPIRLMNDPKYRGEGEFNPHPGQYIYICLAGWYACLIYKLSRQSNFTKFLHACSIKWKK